METVLDHHSVGFGQDLQEQVNNLIIKPYSWDNRGEIALDCALLCDLELLAENIKIFLHPLLPSLDVLVFFELRESQLFTLYLKNTLQPPFKLLDSHDTQQPNFAASNEVTSCNRRKQILNQAIQSVVVLLRRLCDGSATLQEVTLYGSLPLCEIQVEDECKTLTLFAQLFLKENPHCNGLNGVTALLELLQIYGHIFTIQQVCSQFELSEVESDPDLSGLVAVAEELKSETRRGTLTMEDAVIKLSFVKEKLQIKDSGNQDIFQLFSVLKDGVEFFEFAKTKGFIGIAGRKHFTQIHTLVTTQLQHEEHDQDVLNHLQGCFAYIEPFLLKQSTFKALMDMISALPNIEMGIKQLRTVIQNMSIIKLWFEV